VVRNGVLGVKVCVESIAGIPEGVAVLLGAERRDFGEKRAFSKLGSLSPGI
jgi:hypothetical protein